MATQWNNTVPLGQAGTGAAYVLPRSSAAANFGQQLQYYDQRRQIDEERRRREAQRVANSYRENMLTASSGRLWANEIGKMEQDHIRQGMQYRAQGWDVYNPDPNNAEQLNASQQYLQDRARIESIRGYRANLEKQYIDLQKTLEKADIGEYNPADIQKLHDFVSGNTLSDLYEQNAALPSVRKRFDPSSVLPQTATTTDNTTFGNNMRRREIAIDEQATAASVLASIANAPGGREYLNELTGGINPSTLLSIPNNREEIRAQILKDYQGDPQLRERLATSPTPVVPDSPALDRWVDEQADRLYQAKQRFQPQFDSWMSQVTGGTKTGITETPDYAAANYSERIRSRQLAERREARLANEAKSSGSDATYIGATSIPAGRESSGNQGTVPIRDAINLANATVAVTGGEAYNLDSRSPERDTPSISGQIVNLGEYPFDASGNVVDETGISAAPVTWRKMALIRQTDGGITKNILVPANKIPATLSGNKQKMVNEFLKNTEIEQETQTNDADPLGLGI